MISIKFSKSSYYPGETIQMQISFDFKNEIKIRGVYLYLVSKEVIKKEVYRHITHDEAMRLKEMGIHTDKSVERHEHIERREKVYAEKKILPEGVLRKQVVVESIKIPDNATPTSYEFGHDNMINEWYIKVKVDIPFAVDINHLEKVVISGLSH